MHPLSHPTLMTEDSPAADTDPSDGVPSAAEERRRQLEFQRRQLFSQAQEKFAAADFDGARRCLEEISFDYRTPDVQRLFQLVAERLSEIDRLRRDIETNVQWEAYEALPGKIRRFLELQPGDEWAAELLHELEDENAKLFGEFERLEAASQARPREKRRRTKPRPGRSRRARGAAVPVEIVDDDTPVDKLDDEVWEFGERLAVPAPPPLRSKPGRRRNDIDDLIVEQPSQAGVWIAVAVSSTVILLAVIVTVIVLVMEKTQAG